MKASTAALVGLGVVAAGGVLYLATRPKARVGASGQRPSQASAGSLISSLGGSFVSAFGREIADGAIDYIKGGGGSSGADAGSDFGTGADGFTFDTDEGFIAG